MTMPAQSPPTPAQGREKIPQWTDQVWTRLEAAVHEEMNRARVAARFLPTVHVPAKQLTVPSDVVVLPTGEQTSGTGVSEAGSLSVDEGATTRINEYWVEFLLTAAQVEHEAMEESAMAKGQGASTGITLATRAANILAQAEDTVIFQGSNAVNEAPLFVGSSAVVNSRVGNPLDLGLLNIVLTGSPQPQPSLPNPDQIIAVYPVSAQVPGQQLSYQGNTVTAVAQAYSILQSYGQYGPYALVLETYPYADTFSPLSNTLILPADPIKELVTAGFFGTGTLPPWIAPVLNPRKTTDGLPPLPTTVGNPNNYVVYTGVLVSLGGNTMDLVRGQLHPDHDVGVKFEQKDSDGNYRFRVVERFALRLKDPTAVVLLEFLALPLA